MVEVGVWKGDNAGKILRMHPSARLTLVDPWAPASGSYATSGSSDSKLSREEFDRIAEQARGRVARYGKRVEILRMTSLGAAAIMAMVDVVFIDADHSYEGCYSDIMAWVGHARLWLGGHDYGKKSFPGVSMAVDELCPDAIGGADSTWWLDMRGRHVD